MEEFFKKGSIVPKRLGLVDIPRKSRHQIVFNCDCVVIGKTIMPLKQYESVFLLKAGKVKTIKYIKFLDINISSLMSG